MLEAFLTMLRNVLIFVALALPGYILVKCKLLKEKETGILSKVLTYIGVPFLILSSTLNITFNSKFTKNILLIGGIGILFTVGLFSLSILLSDKKQPNKVRNMQRFCMVFSNNGFLGIPLAKAVFGDSPVVTYLIILNIVTNVLMFTLGVYLISGDKSMISLKKALLNPVLIAFALGIILNLTKATKYVPEVGIYSGHFSGMVTPLSMLILGIKMANVKLGAIFTKLAVHFVSAVKLICMPALGVAILFLVKLIYAVDADMLIGFFIAFAMPTAGLASTFSDRYDGDTENAVAFTLGSTIFSIATIPVLYWLLCLLVY